MSTRKFRTALFIAWRHLFSKKKHSLVNIIAIISALGVMAGAAALIIVLSAYNGLEQLVEDSFNNFNPDFKITAKEGKSFDVSTFPIEKLQKLQGVKAAEQVVSDMVLIEYADKQYLINLKGVEETYVDHLVERKKDLLIDGSFDFSADTTQWSEEQSVLWESGDYGVMGSRAAGTLRLNLNSPELIKLYYPQRKHKALARERDLLKRYLVPGGVFESQTEYDDKFLFCSIDFARSLMSYDQEVTSVEVFLKDPTQADKLQKQVQEIVGEKFEVKNRYEQEDLLFKTMKTEKIVIFVILAFILLIAIFNIIGTLAMMIIEKRDDTIELNYLGADKSLIRRIFVLEGMIISFCGGLVGMLLGWLICILQSTLHLVKIGGGDSGYIIDYYPVKMEMMDFFIVFATIFLISLLASLLPTLRLNLKSQNHES